MAVGERKVGGYPISVVEALAVLVVALVIAGAVIAYATGWFQSQDTGVIAGHATAHSQPVPGRSHPSRGKADGRRGR